MCCVCVCVGMCLVKKTKILFVLGKKLNADDSVFVQDRCNKVFFPKVARKWNKFFFPSLERSFLFPKYFFTLNLFSKKETKRFVKRF